MGRAHPWTLLRASYGIKRIEPTDTFFPLQSSLASAPAALSILVLLQTLQMDRARGHLLSNNNTTDLVTPTLRARHSETFRRTSGTACYTHQYSPGWRTGAQGPPALAYTFGANGVADVEMAPPPSVRLV